MKYNYLEAMESDILEYISENYTEEETRENLETRANRDKWAEELHDDLWAHDRITGNASGSYTFNSYRAQEYVTYNGDLLREALQEFCTEAETIAEKFLDEEWEYFDVTIRCYLLYRAIENALDSLEENLDDSEG
jgi:hypothetical protein